MSGRKLEAFLEGKKGMNEKCGVKWQFGVVSARHQAFGVGPLLSPHPREKRTFYGHVMG